MSEDPNITLSKASRMPRRLLNIASIVCLVACVVLMVFWVRSCFVFDGYLWATGGPVSLNVYSLRGKISVQQLRLSPKAYRGGSFYYVKSMSDETADYYPYAKPNGGIARLGFCWWSLPNGVYFALPYWFVVLASGSLAMLFRLRWPPRFTLYNMFVATTVLAMALGMIAWLDRAWIGK